MLVCTELTQSYCLCLLKLTKQVSLETWIKLEAKKKMMPWNRALIGSYLCSLLQHFLCNFNQSTCTRIRIFLLTYNTLFYILLTGNKFCDLKCNLKFPEVTSKFHIVFYFTLMIHPVTWLENTRDYSLIKTISIIKFKFSWQKLGISSQSCKNAKKLNKLIILREEDSP